MKSPEERERLKKLMATREWAEGDEVDKILAYGDEREREAYMKAALEADNHVTSHVEWCTGRQIAHKIRALAGEKGKP